MEGRPVKKQDQAPWEGGRWRRANGRRVAKARRNWHKQARHRLKNSKSEGGGNEVNGRPGVPADQTTAGCRITSHEEVLVLVGMFRPSPSPSCFRLPASLSLPDPLTAGDVPVAQRR